MIYNPSTPTEFKPGQIWLHSETDGEEKLRGELLLVIEPGSTSNKISFVQYNEEVQYSKIQALVFLNHCEYIGEL